MSNHLGQIYSTTKNAEKYIVLNSQNVELSGNVKLTNGNLDVSQNLIFSNFSVTDKINFRENSGSTSYNIVNNSLTAINDASFNNLEINGKIKLPDSSNNGYGISGESLISQGPNNPPIWNPNYKVYGFYYMSNEFGSTFTASTWTSIKNSNDTYATLGTFTPSDLFTVINVNNLIRIPRTGTYKIDLTVNVFANNFTTDMYVKLTGQVAGVFTNLQTVSFVDNYGQAGDKFYIKTFHINYLGTFNRDDEIGCDAYVGGSSGRINGDHPTSDFQIKRTSICIHNVD